jgi:aminocarboxymuconate-semialdehyde decarboxylase
MEDRTRIQNGRIVIDCHSHWYPAAFFEALLNRKGYPRTERDSDGYLLELAPQSSFAVGRHMVELELILDRMADAGIDILVSNSAPLALVDSFPTDEALELALLLNEAQADAAKSYPDRYFGLATLPMQDPRRAVDVLDDAVGRLGLRGVCIGSNINAQPISSEECWPVYRRLEQLDVPLFLHPTSSIMRASLDDFGLEFLVGFVFDTSVALLRLVLSEVLEKYPKLRIVHPHLGGVLPYLAGRIDLEYLTPWAGNKELPRPPSDYVRRCYTDTAVNNPAALQLATDFYGLDHLLFATDYPWWSPNVGVDLIKDNLPEADQNIVFEQSARKLLGLGGSHA